MIMMRYEYGNNRHNRWVGLRNAYFGLGLLLAINVVIRVFG